MTAKSNSGLKLLHPIIQPTLDSKSHPNQTPHYQNRNPKIGRLSQKKASQERREKGRRNPAMPNREVGRRPPHLSDALDLPGHLLPWRQAHGPIIQVAGVKKAQAEAFSR